MNFILNRNRILATTKGHTIEFKKNEPTHVPPECHEEALAIGAQPETEIEEKAETGPRRPDTAEQVEAQVFAAFEKLMLSNGREEFTAGGAPHPKAVSTILGWKLDAKERDTLWTKFQQLSKES